MDFDKLLKLMVEKKASDLFITAGVPPCVKVNGQLMPVNSGPMSPEKAREAVLSVMDNDQRKEFMRSKELNFAISSTGLGRFRVSAFYQRNHVGMVLRRIETKIPSFDDLHL
ncbi:MAG: type IV pili twitching motility protein PilT, partial [Porticoccaceae bacterium]|nr:type IV pili twitching motility protein PilT [Porticoccaceae bacterium]